MNYFLLLLKLWPLINTAVRIVEKAITQPKTGMLKKTMVMDIIKSSVVTIQEVSTGGQKETWDDIATVWSELEPHVSNLIDVIVGFLFPSK